MVATSPTSVSHLCRYYPYHRIVALNFPHKRFLWGVWHRGQVHVPWMPVFFPHARHFQCVYQNPRLFRSSLRFRDFCRSLIFLFMTPNSSRCRMRRSSSFAAISLSRRLQCFSSSACMSRSSIPRVSTLSKAGRKSRSPYAFGGRALVPPSGFSSLPYVP